MTPDVDTRSRWHPSRALDRYARFLVGLRWFVLAGWIAGAAAVLSLPAIGQGGQDLSQLVSADNPAVQSEVRSFDKFGVPLLSRVAVVQYNARGLPADVLARAVSRAREVRPGTAGAILAAIPITNAVTGVAGVPGTREHGTTIVTYLFTSPDVALADQVIAGRQFIADHYRPDDAVIGLTGSVPARVAQSDIVLSSLTWLEAATVAAVFLIVAIAFRSLVAPVIALAVAGVAVLFTLHVGGALAAHFGIAVPQETQPLLVALLLGVVTDYVVFYLSAARTQLAAGTDRLAAARWATARFSPIIATAGATAAAGTGALVVAGSPTFRAFGPGMGLAVLIGMIVAVTLVPALLAILGPALFWSPFRRRQRVAEEAAAPVAPPSSPWSRALTWPGVSVVVLAACLGGLLWAAAPARHMNLGLSFIDALPADNAARVAADRAESGFAGGILSPTELLIEGPAVTSRTAALAKLQAALAAEPGVAAVIGPANDAVPEIGPLLKSSDGTAARYLIVLSDEPLGAQAVHTLTRIRNDLPGLTAAAGLGPVRTGLAGDTAIATAIVDQTMHDLGRIAIAALIANLLFLVLYLRALLAPLALLACSLLAIGATLGLTVRVFQDTLGHDGLTFYVPFAAAVVLMALGSDYNIFGIGPAWKEARTRPLREALAITLPQSAKAIRTAAFTLAASFALLALVPLRPFRELAFALSVGILIDAFVVRSLLAPALLSVIGTASQWPGRQLRRKPLPWRKPRPIADPVPVAVAPAVPSETRTQLDPR
jgi:RND superfamily putative drug exporter